MKATAMTATQTRIGLTPELSHRQQRPSLVAMMMVKFHGPVKTEDAVAVGCSDFVKHYYALDLSARDPVQPDDVFGRDLVAKRHELLDHLLALFWRAGAVG